MQFTIHHKDSGSKARTGTVTTDHGQIKTPVFMPVGTAGTVKAIHNKDLSEQVNARIILGNTYHLYLRPGTEILRKAGGLHKFNSWNKPILTDSGGYQVYSLAHRRKLREEGVVFQSHIDGSRHTFSPEIVMDIQRIIGGDIIMAFDECTPYPCDLDYAENSMHLTHRWLKRCCEHFDNTPDLYGYSQTLFPIVQGSTYPELRKQSAEFVASCNREGNAIGGLSVGEPAEMMYEMTELVCGILPQDKPRYLMGVGTPANILESIALGVDMFDCVMPTRNARNGMLFTSEGIINMRNRKWIDDFSPIDPDNHTFVDTMYNKAYLRHLYTSNEMLGPMIGTMHNLGFYLWLVDEAAKHIENNTFADWKNQMVPRVSRRL
ncbi:MAG: tRNA guanosine(34) transglycosylase Tgt [Bacteroidetes bacterium]|nr:MAG: tRNA guanosine(34) transglycosylase Tgt [Bacteroidota bacterium]